MQIADSDGKSQVRHCGLRTSMADVVDIALNIGGWLAAGLVTALGVLLAYRLERRARERDQDLQDVYLPLRSQLMQVIEGARNLDRGGVIWNFSSEDFDRIARGGLLKLKRHAALEEDVRDLESLRGSHGAAYAPYDRASRRAAENAMRTGTVWTFESDLPLSVLQTVRQNAGDGHLLVAIAADDRAAWVKRVTELVQDEASRGDQVAVAVGSLYDEIAKEIGPSRKAFRDSGMALVAHARNMLSRIDDAIRSGSRY